MVQGGAWDVVIQWLSYGEDVGWCGGTEIDLVTRLGMELKLGYLTITVKVKSQKR